MTSRLRDFATSQIIKIDLNVESEDRIEYAMQFQNLKKMNHMYTFTVTPIHVSYINTLRRLILTGVETVAFRSDMTATGSTTDVIVKRNDTPMTNEMLADRIGLLPIYVREPLAWKPDNYVFILKAEGNKDTTRYVTCSDFKILDMSVKKDEDKEEEEQKVSLPVDDFFPRNRITNESCLIASLQPGTGSMQQKIEIIATATIGTGREHARFSPVSQCSYEYSLDTNPERIEEMFLNWLVVSKKYTDTDKASKRYQELQREFNTMQIKRCFKVNEKGEPYSFDFTIETIGVLSIDYIVERACEVGENMCSRFINIYTSDLPAEITITPSDSRLIGYDFLVRGQDHTLGNLLQTWLVENHIEGSSLPKITYAGYCIPHPLRDEMVLRIGVEDGGEATARKAFAEAAKGCAEMFRAMRVAWRSALGAVRLEVPPKSKVIRKTASVTPKAKVTKAVAPLEPAQ